MSNKPALIASLTLAASALPFVFAGCGAAEVIRKDAPTASEATGEKCDPKAESANVYVLDLPPEKRSDIELALGTDGLAVVSFNCKEMKVLKTCHAGGTYMFKGTSPKERVVSLESADAIRATLPLGGAGIAASFEAEAGTGTKFDLGLVLAGQSVGSASAFTAAELTGNCDGATHVITAGKMGAFAMGTSSKAEMKTAVEIFGAGAGAGSSSSKIARTRDGSIEACNKAEANAFEPPKGCDALLAVEVTKLQKGFGAVEVDPFFSLTYGDDACKAGNYVICEDDCNAGKGKGCRQSGIALIEGTGVDKNIPKGVQLLKKACDLGDVKGCAALGSALSFEERNDEAIPFAEKACTVGNDADGCFTLGLIYELAKKDKDKADKAYSKACKAGVNLACKKIGVGGDDPPSE